MKNLKELRIKNKLTGEQLGALVNVKKAAISKYERGDIQPSQEVLIALAKALSTSVDYLLGVSGNSNPYEELPLISIGTGGKRYILDIPNEKIEKFKKMLDVVFEDEKVKGI